MVDETEDGKPSIPHHWAISYPFLLPSFPPSQNLPRDDAAAPLAARPWYGLSESGLTKGNENVVEMNLRCHSDGFDIPISLYFYIFLRVLGSISLTVHHIPFVEIVHQQLMPMRVQQAT